MSAPRDSHALVGHAPLKRHTRPLVGGVSCPPQWVPMVLAVLRSSQPPASAAAAESMGAAMEGAPVMAAAEEVAAAELKEAEDAKAEAAEAAEAVTVATAAATTEPAAAEAVKSEAVGRRPIRGSYGHGLDAISSWSAPLPSVGLAPFLLLGLLLSGAVCSAAPTTRSRLRGHDASNSRPSTVLKRPGLWLMIGWLAFASGFRLSEGIDGVTQIGARDELAHASPLSSHEPAITSEVDGARDRLRLIAGSKCDDSWCVSSRTPPPFPRPPCVILAAFLLAAMTIAGQVVTADVTVRATRVRAAIRSTKTFGLKNLEQVQGPTM